MNQKQQNFVSIRYSMKKIVLILAARLLTPADNTLALASAGIRARLNRLRKNTWKRADSSARFGPRQKRRKARNY
jgi:hypothetical protein